MRPRMQFVPSSAQSRCSAGIGRPETERTEKSKQFDCLDDPLHASQLPKEHRIEVRAVNLRVAHGARLIFSRLVVE